MELTINGRRVDCNPPHDEPLLWTLRDRLDLKGTKYGCGVGVCGICTVLIDGEPCESCTMAAADAAGREITTIEGLAAADRHGLLTAWVTERVAQCGYCQPGMIVSASALLDRTPDPDDAAIDAALSHVVCRCGTYGRVRRAVHRAAAGDLRPADVGNAGTAREVRDGGLSRAVPLNPWIAIAEDGSVTFTCDRTEMGQDALTGLAVLAAEELDVDLAGLRFTFAPVDPVYDNPAFGEQQTSGSTSVRASWTPLRTAAARARQQLVAAAADEWQVSEADCRTETGRVVHPPTGRILDYGALAGSAASIRLPQDPPLKPASDWRLIGRDLSAVDGRAKSDGSARYGVDVDLPDMLYATLLHPPVGVGGGPGNADTADVEGAPGVEAVMTLDDGTVAVVATDSWSALKASENVAIDPDKASSQTISDADIRRQLREAAKLHGRVALDRGDADAALDSAAKTLHAIYDTPYLAHAPMEPMNCTVHLRDVWCDVWAPTQVPTRTRDAAAGTAGLDPDRVRVHSTYVGSGFGRRLETDFVEDAVRVARRVGRPVQVFWRRDEDMRHDRYRPAHHVEVRGGLDRDGRPVAWRQRTAGPALALGDMENPYAIPNLREETVEHDPGIPTGPWRSVGASQNAFVIESFVDELAGLVGADPVAFRRALLDDAPRHRGVLDLVAEKAGWDAGPPDGRHRGVAVYYHRGSWGALVAEVSTGARRPRVERLVCAVDCGIAVDPGGLRAQIEGGIVFGLSAALWGRITIADGAVRESSFGDYRVLRIDEMPEIDVHILPSPEPPGGIGELAVPLVAPAVANAWFAATGERRRQLPLAADA